MSYQINFRDRSSATVSTEDGKAIKELLLRSKPPANIEIHGELYRTSEVVSVKVASDDLALEPARTLPPAKSCRGQYSIQREINNIIRHDYPQAWATKIKDEKLRNKLRQELLDGGAEWCDSMAQMCICDSGYTSAERPSELKVLE